MSRAFGEAWRPRAGPDVARRRAEMMRQTRRFFAERNVLEVSVPSLSASAASDPNIDSLEVRSLLSASPRYLHTSPEYAMKRLLAAGFPDIVYIGSVFRDGEAGRRHQPEFTMIEWYRLGHDLDAIMSDAEALVVHLLEPVLDDTQPLRVSYREAFESALGVDALSADAAELADIAAADAALRQSLGADRDAWLDLLLTSRVTPTFSTARVTTLYHYPASQAALARLNADNSLVADRFELFLGETEVANGYVELTDADEQARRFEADNALRKRQGKPQRPADAQLIAALRAGLPPCAGVAAGFDRLLMLRTSCADIRDVLHFVWE